MKSAYELAMERMGGPLREYTEEQKERLAEIDQKYDALVAEAKLNTRRRTQEGDDAESSPQEDLTVELASIEERREREKQTVRDETGAE